MTGSLLTAGVRADRSTDDANPSTVLLLSQGVGVVPRARILGVRNSLKLRAAVGESGNEPLYGQKFGELAVVNYAGAPGSAAQHQRTERRDGAIPEPPAGEPARGRRRSRPDAVRQCR